MRAVDAFFEEASLAALYDALYLDTPREDYDFYRPLAMAAGSILDLGCGTGSFLRDLTAAGHEGRLVGIDPARGMIDRARAYPGVEWRQGDASSIGSGDRFDLIVMTGHAFQALVEDDAITDLLRRVRTALSSTGRFAFETREPAARAWDKWTPDRPVLGCTPDGAAFAMRTHVEAGFDGRTVTFRHDFLCTDGAMIGTSRSTLRFLDAGTLDGLLAAAGLEVSERYGDFDGDPCDGNCPEIITIARAV